MSRIGDALESQTAEDLMLVLALVLIGYGIYDRTRLLLILAGVIIILIIVVGDALYEYDE